MNKQSTRIHEHMSIWKTTYKKWTLPQRQEIIVEDFGISGFCLVFLNVTKNKYVEGCIDYCYETCLSVSLVRTTTDYSLVEQTIVLRGAKRSKCSGCSSRPLTSDHFSPDYSATTYLKSDQPVMVLQWLSTSFSQLDLSRMSFTSSFFFFCYCCSTIIILWCQKGCRYLPWLVATPLETTLFVCLFLPHLVHVFRSQQQTANTGLKSARLWCCAILSVLAALQQRVPLQDGSTPGL